MKYRIFLLGLAMVFAAEIGTLIVFTAQATSDSLDTVMVNEVVQSLQEDWSEMETHQNATSLDYVALDKDGILVYRTKPGLSESINAAVKHRDTILDILVEGKASGKVIIYNDS